MSTVVVRLFLRKAMEPTVRSALKQINVNTIEGERPSPDLQVINIFDPAGFQKVKKRSFPDKEQALLIARGDFSLEVFQNIDKSLKEKGAVLLGIVDPSQSDWRLYFKYLLG
jgi:hypothetical protein